MSLLSMLADWKSDRDAKHFERGYDFAAGILLRSNGFSDPSNMIWMDKHNDAFDRGIVEACFDWSASHRPPTRRPESHRLRSVPD